jgi:hypothetical protein
MYVTIQGEIVKMNNYNSSRKNLETQMAFEIHSLKERHDREMSDLLKRQAAELERCRSKYRKRIEAIISMTKLVRPKS